MERPPLSDRELFARGLAQTNPVLDMFIKHHVTHKNVHGTLRGYRYLLSILMDKAAEIRAMKSTQCGITEWLICRALTRSAAGRNTFYVFPTYVLKNQFVQERVEKSIAFTPLYQRMVAASETSAEGASLKNIGKGSVAFVGSNTTSAFTSYPADDAIVDETDECDQGNLAMVPERLAASKDPTLCMVGNPKYDDFGIDHEFKRSDMKRWHIKCDACGRWFSPDFFKNVVRDEGDGDFVVLDDSYDPEKRAEISLLCECGAKVDRYKPGYWIEQARSHVSGYQINQLFSANVRLFDLVEKFGEALKNETKLQRFHNGNLGLPFTAKGSRIDFASLNACKRDYLMPDHCENPCAAGIDVGSVLHTVIQDTTNDRLVFIGEVADFDELKDLYRRYNVKIGVIDGLPELHQAKKIRDSHPGMFVCFLSGNVKKDDIARSEKRSLSVDRTVFLDEVKESLSLERILFPMNADALEPIEKDGVSQFYHMINNSVRVFDEDKQVYRWIEGSRPDHYLFALGFLNLARKLVRRS